MSHPQYRAALVGLVCLVVALLSACSSAPETNGDQKPGAQATFKDDVSLICHAIDAPEVQEASAADRQQALSKYVMDNIQTQEGDDLFVAIGNAAAGVKGEMLGKVAAEQGVKDCPMADAMRNSIKRPGMPTNRPDLNDPAMKGLIGAVSGQDAKALADKSNVQITGSLDKATIKEVIQGESDKVRFCYEKELANNPSLGAGQVMLKFTIGADGKVQATSVESSTLGSAPVEQCLTQAASRWVFPEPKGGGVVVVNYPFDFKSAP